MLGEWYKCAYAKAEARNINSRPNSILILEIHVRWCDYLIKMLS